MTFSSKEPNSWCHETSFRSGLQEKTRLTRIPQGEELVMSCRCATIALLLLAVVACPGAGQVKLEWKFKEGDKFSARIVTSCKGKVVLGGETRDQEAENNTVL